MNYLRYFIASMVFGAAVVSAAAPVHGAAPILSEVRKQLTEAHKCVEDGSWDYATAHADLVLIADNVSVNVNVAGVQASQRQACLKALDACFARWESALNGSVNFRLEDDPAKADLKVTFRSDVRLNREPVAGLTNWTRMIRGDAGRVVGVTFKADVQVRTLDLSYRQLSFEAMRQETEHEFGHVLGLEDSDHIGDLMGEFDMEHLVSGPRDYEVQAVKSLRDEAKQIKVDAAAKNRSAGQSAKS